MVQNDPQAMMSVAAQRMFAKPSESWKPVDIDGDGRNDFQQSSITGEYKDMPKTLSEEERLRPVSNTTINNIPAEVGARIGLGEGFLANFDELKKKATDFFSGNAVEQAKRRGQIAFNTGEGGKLWRDVETGKEALIRGLTGAGMAHAEAENQASRYGISQWDTAYDVQTKLDGLKRDLENVAKGIYKVRGGTYSPPSGGGTGELTYNPATGRLE